MKTVGKRGPAVDSEALAAVDSRDFDTMVDMVLRKHMELSHAMDCFVKEGRINITVVRKCWKYTNAFLFLFQKNKSSIS